MFDLNAILSTALQQAVEAATKPLLERIATLEQTLSAMHNVTDDDLALFEQRIEKLEERSTGGGLTREEVREIADEAASEAISSHNYDYDHDEFVSDLSSIDWSNYIDIDDQVQDAVNNLTFSVSVS